jgi:hypothetical protein
VLLERVLETAKSAEDSSSFDNVWGVLFAAKPEMAMTVCQCWLLQRMSQEGMHGEVIDDDERMGFAHGGLIDRSDSEMAAP